MARIAALFESDEPTSIADLERLVSEVGALVKARFPDIDLALEWGGRQIPPGSRAPAWSRGTKPASLFRNSRQQCEDVPLDPLRRVEDRYACPLEDPTKLISDHVRDLIERALSLRLVKREQWRECAEECPGARRVKRQG